MAEKTLRSPEFGNTWRMVPNSILHRNLSGELLPGRIPEKPIPEGFSVTIKALNYDQLERFKAFMIATAGQEISMTDFEGRDWVGVITSPQLEITKYALAKDCVYQIKFDFEGSVSGIIRVPESEAPAPES